MNKKKLESSAAETIIADWLKNRPSIIFMLLSSGSVICISQLPFLHMWTSEIDKWFVILLESVIAIALFLFSLPVTSWMYIKIIHNKRDTNIIYVLVTALGLFLLLFELPILLMNIYNKELGLFLVLSIGVSIYGFLLFISLRRKKHFEKADRINVEKLLESIRKLKESSTDDLEIDHLASGFYALSCKGQIDFLLRLQESQESKINRDLLKKLEQNAKTIQALELIFEKYG